jgi:hypothetical protein
MIRILKICFGLVLINISLFANNVWLADLSFGKAESTDSLPDVFPKNRADILENKLRLEASVKFGVHQLPSNLKDLEAYRSKLKNEIVRETGVIYDHKLPLNIKETGTVNMKGYAIKKITFQTRPGVYTTANLFIPDGKGPFPAVIYMLGHWPKGKIDSTGPQAVGHTLAVNGYVCLTVDPWGSGERTTVHGVFEDHGDGNNLGSALLNLGETLMGIELSDNIRGVDLLSSLPYVSPDKIGATGASGGGNQTMWLTAMDERIKASVPVVSVGTFGSYILGTPCICEVIIDALTITEEAGILALIAPRAVKMLNHKKDANPAFNPAEMIRSYNNVRPVFKMLGVENNITYQLFDLVHGYMAEDREAMLGWFDLHLKGTGNGAPRKEIPFTQLPEEKLMVFAKGQRDANVIGTDEYCKRRGKELRNVFLSTASFDLNQKKNELKSILRISERSDLKEAHQYSGVSGWNRLTLETTDNKLIPVLLRTPAGNSGEYVIIIHPGGKGNIPSDIIDAYTKSGLGIAIADLSGTGESSLASPRFDYFKGRLRTLQRSEFWLGKTVIGEWVKELNVIAQFLKSGFKAQKITIDGTKEAGLAALSLGVLEGNTDNIILRDAPVSYLYDNRENIDFYSNAIFLPGFLKWGDVSLMAGLYGKNIKFINPLTTSGQKISGDKLKEYQTEFEKIKNICRQSGKTTFN